MVIKTSDSEMFSLQDVSLLTSIIYKQDFMKESYGNLLINSFSEFW